MKALVKTARGPGNLEIREVPEPLCGKVVEVGKNVTRFKTGDRIAAENVCINCGGSCYLCSTGHYAICIKRGAQGLDIDGAFANYVTCDEKNVYRIPDNITYEEGALSEPLVCSVHAVLDQTKVGAGDVVLVSGPGAIGLLAAQAAKAEGGTVILSGTTADEKRFALARDFGIDRTVDVQKENLRDVVLGMTGGLGADVFIECSGVAAAVDAGIAALKKRGRITQVGLFGKKVPVNLDALVVRELQITGSMSHTRNAWERGFKLVEQGKIRLEPLITAVYPIDQWEKAFKEFEERKGIKILLKPLK